MDGGLEPYAVMEPGSTMLCLTFADGTGGSWAACRYRNDEVTFGYGWEGFAQ
jgi:hypothetical protein